MPEYEKTIEFSNKGTRNEVRMRLVDLFSKEVPGKGRNELASRYTYYVESLKDGNRIYLRRPANLHNGFDFLVCVENYNFADENSRKRNFPKHEDIIQDLKFKKDESEKKYEKLVDLMKKIYECKELKNTEYHAVNFNYGFTSEVILKTLKWLFLEQDIRYWNYSGRCMLWNGILDI